MPREPEPCAELFSSPKGENTRFPRFVEPAKSQEVYSARDKGSEFEEGNRRLRHELEQVQQKRDNQRVAIFA
jgi:hypothetical protein